MTGSREVPAAALRTLIFSSVRYAVGRQTYMPVLIREIVAPHIDVLSARDREQLADEITDGRGLGHEKLDAPGWLEFAHWLRDSGGRDKP